MWQPLKPSHYLDDITDVIEAKTHLDPASIHESRAEKCAANQDWEQAYLHLRSALAIAQEENQRDPLTGLYNRRHLEKRLRALVLQKSSPNTGIAVAMIDLDHFKWVNDTFGHLIGDQVLRRIATLLQDNLPPDALCARYGGEEFVLIFPSITAASAAQLAEQARIRVAQHPWSEIRQGLTVTISIGVVHENSHTGIGHLLHADNLLYAAKHAGRNTVRVKR